MERIYNKLVRDNIPDIIRSKGEMPVTRVLNDADYKKALEDKLYEEYDEVITSEGSDRCEELADMIEVIRSLAKLENKSLEDIVSLAGEKRVKRGGFDDKIFLEKVKEGMTAG
ncbi:MAG: nucleoside triphosphate pyrophosphohydrolase [Clostridiales bacterium]|nr:nucleoside triphosphate pyrophosphohydrolase [Clostridiales bacterium]